MRACSSPGRRSRRRCSGSRTCSTPMRFAELDAVTVDGFGTLLQLVDPVAPLRDALAAHDVERSPDEVRAAFVVEGRHYRARSHRGCDAPSLRALRLECVGVFLDALEAELA